MMGQLLSGIASSSLIIDTSFPSIVLFGEYPYPSEEDESEKEED